MTLALARRAFAARAALLRLGGTSAINRSPSLAQAAAWQRHQELRRRASWLANAANASVGGDAADDDGSSSQRRQQQRRSGEGGASSKKPRLPSHWACPACGTRCVRPGVFARHLRACCPDLISPEAWREATANAEAGGSVAVVVSAAASPSPSNAAAAAAAALSAESIEAAERLLEGAKRAEEALRERILELSFRTLPPPPLPVSGSDDGKAGGTGAPPPPPPPLPFSRMPVRDVAERLDLPEARVALSLKLAVRATPLVADDRDAPAAGDVLFEDDFVLALAKPSGIITAPKHRHEGGSLVARAIAHLNKGEGNRDGKGEGAPRRRLLPFPVHRLDMATSGVVVMGKSSAAAAALQAQFRGRTARKTYLALVAGGGKEREVGERWDVDAAIGRHPELKVGRRAVVSQERGGGERGRGGGGGGGGDESGNGGDDSAGDDGAGTEGDDDDDSAAQPALTRFAVLARCDGAAVERAMRGGGGQGGESSSLPFSSLFALGELAPADDTLRSLRGGAALLACAPRTGRTHQIRVHASFCGHPILGDDLYGPVPLVDDRRLAPRLLLHAAALELDHPEESFSSSSSSSSSEKKRRKLRLSAPLPAEFRRTMEALGMEWSFEDLPRDLWD